MKASDLQERLGKAETDTVGGKTAHVDLVKSLNRLGPQNSQLPKRLAAALAFPRALSPSLAADLARQTDTRLKNEVPLPGIEDVLATLHGAKRFATLNLEQGLHQVRTAPEDRHKTAFRTLMGQLECALARLLQDKMYPRLEKCKFAAQSIEYLGYHAGTDGVHPSMEKVSAIVLSPTELANESQVRQFLAAVDYCRNSMGPEFAVLARPLQHLLKRKASFLWTAARSSAVQALKDRIVHCIKLSSPDLTKLFILRRDASGATIGAVLEQDGTPLGVLSKRLSDAEMCYSTYDQELLAVVPPLERWRHFLIAAEDPQHASSKVLFFHRQHLSNHAFLPVIRQNLQFELPCFLEELKSDAIPDSKLIPTPTVAPPTNLHVPCYMTRCTHHRNLPRKTLRCKVLATRRGHLGIWKTYNQIATKFYWKGIRECVRTYAERCPRCRAPKAICQKSAGLLQPLSVPSRGWSSISLVFIGGLALNGHGYDAILTVVDGLSKMAHCILTKGSLSTADLFAYLLVACAWHPQTDGETERANRTIEQMLLAYIQSREEE
ncbi:hypothetical protein Esti_001146 [Eimeria stiedai]